MTSSDRWFPRWNTFYASVTFRDPQTDCASLFPGVASATWRRSTSRRASTTSSPPPSYPNRRVPSSWTSPALRPSRCPSSSEDGAGGEGLKWDSQPSPSRGGARIEVLQTDRASALTWWYRTVLVIIAHSWEELQRVSGQIKIRFHQNNIQTGIESRCTSFCHRYGVYRSALMATSLNILNLNESNNDESTDCEVRGWKPSFRVLFCCSDRVHKLQFTSIQEFLRDTKCFLGFGSGSKRFNVEFNLPTLVFLVIQIPVQCFNLPVFPVFIKIIFLLFCVTRRYRQVQELSS